MIPTHVALVAQKGSKVTAPMLMRVAAVLQMQLTRDFTPVWGIPAVVSPFASLRDVPPGCLPLVIVEPGALHSPDHAFHQTVSGRPIGLVEGGAGWSLPASHELLEMVCDPYGKLTVLGDSIADDVSAPGWETWVTHKAQRAKQGQVAYLVEVCDPCQDSSYTINGFAVSDFVTPRYYAAGASDCGGYSFTGRVTKPRQVLPCGYITWYTSTPESEIWQAHCDAGGTLTVGPLAGPESADSRHSVDYATDFVRGTCGSSRPDRSSEGERMSTRSARGYGEELEKDLKAILDSYQPTVDLKKFLPLLRDLAYDKAKYEAYRKAPNSLVSDLKNAGAITKPYAYVGSSFPEQTTFQGAYETLNRQHVRTNGLKNIPDEAAITAMQGTTIWAPAQP